LVTVTFLVGKSEFENRAISVFPNPSKGDLKISGLQLGEQVKIISLTGELFFQKTALYETEKINLPNLKKGTYFVVIEAVSSRKVQKIIKL